LPSEVYPIEAACELTFVNGCTAEFCGKMCSENMLWEISWWRLVMQRGRLEQI
jgi:hypothetical protein